MSAVSFSTEDDADLSDQVVPEDLHLLELNLGPVMRDDHGTRWSPFMEIVDYPGVFHG